MPGYNDYRQYSSVPRPTPVMSDLQKALITQRPASPQRNADGRERKGPEPMSADQFAAAKKLSGAETPGVRDDIKANIAQLLGIGKI